MEEQKQIEALFNEAERLTGIFSAVSSVPARTIRLAQAEQFQCFCEICPLVSAPKNNKQESETPFLRRESTAQNLGGMHTVFCSCGAVGLLSPVLFRSKPIAAVLVGPLLPFSPNGTSVEEIFSRNIQNKHFPPTVQKQTPLRLYRIAVLTKALFCPDETAAPPYDFIARAEEKLLAAYEEKSVSRAEQEIASGITEIYALFSENLSALKNHALQFSLMLCRFPKESSEIQNFFTEWLRELYLCENASAVRLCMQRRKELFLPHFLPDAERKTSDTIESAVRYLRQNYMKSITLSETAKRVFLTPTYFSKKFKEETGKTFNRYLNEIRIEQAKHLLQNTNCSLSEIAARCGFENQSYFTKVFRRITGTSPTSERHS